ncbi:pleckstrin homology domain-containing family G member 3-like isoform X1 [Corythoichthys intestinalis]|uniref:pleckstrin homology domain-containing family G member 3-like isoform X1 n=1 Tax=Corythoichthys intestinalis TaxID=161448 RepID=UPI0025A6840E|nr:pleckstrin homology domain-containing family G member 3-like isoform X1 [Corythoichthys intestinalis]XP_057679523.1 pleckstrin homology domain-containing family G member 3-like isoform X1 [Corythoichthys intestinalis]
MAPTYLDRVVSEIIETERTYVRDLRMIVEDYLAHIIERAEPSVRPEQVCFLFGNIEDIYEFNSELLQDLDLCRQDAVAVARCFVSKSEYFEIYTQYCTNYPNSVAALTDCMQDKSLAVFFRERQAASERPLPLGSYLLKPVQRILKYHLLLQEIAKHFDPEEEGYEVVEEAICTMTAVAWYINDMKRKHEHAVRLQEVQSLLLNWKGPDLTTYGELVLEGTFKVHRAKNQRTLFLLERVLLITKRRGEHYVYKTHISCSALMLIESTKDSLSFSVTHYKRPKQPHTVQAKSAEEKTTWAQHIKRVILENHHAIIPQKAKDAIMNSRYPRRYRHCPERLKKAESTSSDEFPRRRSAEVNREPEPGIPAGRVGLLSEETERSRLSFNGSNEEGGLGEEEELVAPSEQMSTEDQVSASEYPPTPERDEPEPTRTEGLQSKAGSGAESSSDEDDEKEADKSILPSSVLDKAGAIARHFSGVKPGAPPRDDVLFSPNSAVRHRLSFGGGAPSSPGWDRAFDDGFDREGGIARRRDSRLSGRDRLLIGKIKNYYENAENRDAGFGLRRRESLTYIPAGLVKTSVGRLDGPPVAESRWPPANSKGRAVSGDLSDNGTVAHADRKDSATFAGGFSGAAEDEEFRPSGDMLKVWQVMERQLSEVADGRPEEEGARRPRENTFKRRTQDASLPPGPHEEADAADGKVRHLARRYSQRLKSDKAPDGRTLSLTGKKMLARVPEECPGNGPSPTVVGDRAPSLSPEPTSGAPRSAEGFDWPDVRELRSKYSEADQSRIVPESASQRRRSSSDAPPRRSHATWNSAHLKSHKGLHRARSLDPGRSGAIKRKTRQEPSERPEDVDNRGPPKELSLRTTAELEGATGTDPDDAEAYVEIRSPTSREKISLLAVADRCRAYQESDEYQLRRRAAKRRDGAKTALLQTSSTENSADSQYVDSNLVKNLREKFQKLNS